MAYEIKYRVTFATKSGINSFLYLLEDGYDGDIIDYDGIDINLQYIPKSDDIYEPIVVSQLDVIIDITNDVDNMPNFTTLNDRKYLVQLFSNDNLQWQGWALSDNVGISFTTGRKELAFNAIDGLGMLESISYQLPNEYYYINTKKLLDVLLECIDFIEFPESLNLLSGISYFANGMSDRLDLGSNETLNQTYVRLTTVLDKDLNSINCLDLIRDIAKSFGCRFFQAEGMWFIVPLNEFANDTYYYTIYNSASSVVSYGERSKILNIQGYTGNTSGAYFTDNGQVKILKKGYNKISINKDIEYPNNYITNFNLKNYIGNVAAGWNGQFNGSGSSILIKPYSFSDLNSYILYKEDNTTSYAWISPLNMPTVSYLDDFEVGFNIVGAGSFGIPVNTMYVKIMLDNGYFWDNNEEWSSTVTSTSYYYPIPYSPNIKGTQSISCTRVPFNSSLTIQFYVGTIQGIESGDWVELNDFSLSVSQRVLNVKINSFYNDSNEYVYELDLPYGFNGINLGKYYYRGFLCDSLGESLYNWYNQRTSSTVYNSLAELIISAYSNSLIKNNINVDCSFFAVPTESGVQLNNSTLYKMTDLDNVNSVEDKPYILGNTTISLVNNEAQVTLLELERNTTPTTITIDYSVETQGTPYPLKRSLPQSTNTAANIAPLTDNIVYIIGNSTSAYSKAVAYTDQYCSIPFNGNNAWYKIQGVNLINYRVYFIRPNGICDVNDPR